MKAVSGKKSKVHHPLFLEKATECVHHAVAATTLGRRTTVLATVLAAMGRLGRVAAVAVLLDSVFGNAANDGSTDCSENAVVGLVAGESTGRTTCEGTGKTTLALLGFTGGTMLLLFVTTVVC